MGCAVHTVRPVHNYLVNLLHALDKAFFQVIELLDILIIMLIHDLCSLRNSCNTGHVLGPGTHTALLASAKHDGFKLHVAVHIKESDSLRSVYLVSADREHINIHLFRINSGLAEALYRIDMEKKLRIHFLNQCTGLCNGLLRTDLIIRIHNGNQYGLSGNSALQIFKADTALLIHRQIGYPEALFLQIFHCLQNGRMFN